MERATHFVATPEKLDEYRVRRHFPALQAFGPGSGAPKIPTTASRNLKQKARVTLRSPKPRSLRSQRLRLDAHKKGPYLYPYKNNRNDLASTSLHKKHWSPENFDVLSKLRTRIIMQPGKSDNLPAVNRKKVEERVKRRPWRDTSRVEASKAIQLDASTNISIGTPYSAKQDHDNLVEKQSRARWLNKRGFLASSPKRALKTVLYSVHHLINDHCYTVYVSMVFMSHFYMSICVIGKLNTLFYI